MNPYKKSRLIVAVSIIIVLSCSLLFVTTNGNGFGQTIISNIRNSLSSIESFLAQPTQLFSKEKESLAALLTTYEENQSLKQTLSVLEGDLLETETLKAQNDSLRQSLSMKQSYPDKNLLAALVSVRLPISWTNQIIIDVGSEQNVKKEMLVLANGGLIGIIESVESQSATVKLLTNADEFTKIPVKIIIGEKAVYGILSGYDTDKAAFIVTQLNSIDEIALNSNVVTSDLGGTLPSNIQIGIVSEVNQKKGSLDRELFIKPSADFDTVFSVLVVGE